MVSVLLCVCVCVCMYVCVYVCMSVCKVKVCMHALCVYVWMATLLTHLFINSHECGTCGCKQQVCRCSRVKDDLLEAK